MFCRIFDSRVDGGAGNVHAPAWGQQVGRLLA